MRAAELLFHLTPPMSLPGPMAAASLGSEPLCQHWLQSHLRVHLPDWPHLLQSAMWEQLLIAAHDHWPIPTARRLALMNVMAVGALGILTLNPDRIRLVMTGSTGSPISGPARQWACGSRGSRQLLTHSPAARAKEWRTPPGKHAFILSKATANT